jgi:predicted lipid-binding transport protein (Tim44 family)
MPPADAPRPNSIASSSPPVPAGGEDDYAPSALPSTFARALAFASILLGGLCGGLIGWSLVDLTCESGDCGTSAGLAGLVGAVIGAGGVAVVAVLALRAMGEWRTIQHRKASAQLPTDAAPGRR